MTMLNEEDTYPYRNSSEMIKSNHYNAIQWDEVEILSANRDYIVDCVMLPLVGILGIPGNVCGIIHFGTIRHQKNCPETY